MNLYRGCTHGCIYCDSRSVCYQMAHDFEDIEVKRGALEILEEQMRRKRKPCMIGTGAMCDPYIPLEDELKITRGALELIARMGFGLAIQTKSARVLRDIDVLREINARAKCVVQMTLTTCDEALCRIVEPEVSTTAERVRALEALRDAGIPTVVWISPLLPFINDTEENLRGLLDYCGKAGVWGIISFGFGMTLRDGNREYFYRKLDEHFPGLKDKYVRQYGLDYECRSSNDAGLWRVFDSECERLGIRGDRDEVFRYLGAFETKTKQLSMFNYTEDI